MWTPVMFLQTLYSCVMNWYYYAFPFTQVNKEFCTNVHVCSCVYFSFLKQFVLITLFCQVSRAVFPKEATSHCFLWQFYLTAMSSIARTAILKQKSQQNAVDTPSISPTSHDTAYTQNLLNSEVVCIIWNNNLLHQVTWSKLRD